MKNLKITRVVLAILALVGFTGVQTAISAADLQNSSVYQNTYGNQVGNQQFSTSMSQQSEWPEVTQVSDSADAGLMQQWKDYIDNNPNVDLSTTDGFDSFNQSDQLTLLSYQQSLSSQDADDGQEEPWDDDDQEPANASSALMQQWKTYIADNNLNKAQLEGTDGFSSFNQSDQIILLGYALRNAIDAGINNSGPATGTQSKWNSFTTGTQKAGGYLNSTGQWVVNTEIGQGVTQEVKEIRNEMMDEIKPELKAGTRSAVRGIIGWGLNKLVKGSGDAYQAQQAQSQWAQGGYPSAINYQQGPQPKGVQYGTVSNPKLYPGNQGVLLQPGVNVQRTPAGPPLPPGTQRTSSQQFGNNTPPVVNHPAVSGGYASPTGYNQPAMPNQPAAPVVTTNSAEQARQGLSFTPLQKRLFNGMWVVITTHPEYKLEHQIGWSEIGSAAQQRLKEIQQSLLSQN